MNDNYGSAYNMVVLFLLIIVLSGTLCRVVDLPSFPL